MRLHANFYQRRAFGTLVAIALSLGASAAVAHAHGGMAGPDELGPPLFTSAALAFAGYWIVILWPSRRHESDNTPTQKKTNSGGGRFARPTRKLAAPTQPSDLRKVQGNRGQSDGVGPRRRASDV